MTSARRGGTLVPSHAPDRMPCRARQNVGMDSHTRATALADFTDTDPGSRQRKRCAPRWRRASWLGSNSSRHPPLPLLRRAAANSRSPEISDTTAMACWGRLRLNASWLRHPRRAIPARGLSPGAPTGAPLAPRQPLAIPASRRSGQGKTRYPTPVGTSWSWISHQQPSMHFGS
jgi:hypothetical protein